MVEAFGWGALASVSLLLGASVVFLRAVPARVLGLVMAFGAGVLISAVSFELVLEGSKQSPDGVWLGLFAGAAVYYAGDALLDRYGGHDRKASSGAQASGSGLAIALGIVLDGVPESAVLGITILDAGSVSVAVLVAVFLSNVPEAVAATSGLRKAGWPRARILGLWTLVTAVCGVASAVGFGAFGDASPVTLAFVLAFAAGAILTMLADTMMPEAFGYGGRQVGLLTTLGFGVAFAISALQ